MWHDHRDVNLAVLNASRRAPRAGDVFVLRPAGHGFFVGRVIDPRANLFGFRGPVVLAYIYATEYDTPLIPAPAAMNYRDLLIPPLGTNRLPWSKGFFETIGNVPLRADDVLSRHVFHRTSLDRDQYLDQAGNPVVPADEPIGTWGLDSYRTIDDAVSDALGIPRAE